MKSKRNKTTFGPDCPPPKSPGRPRLTEAQKREARLKRAAEYDYKMECRAMMPLVTDQILTAVDKKKFEPNELVGVFEVLRDTVHGKPAQTIQGAGGGPLVGSFTLLLGTVDGSKVEKLHDAALAHGSNGNGNGHAHEKL